MQQNERKTSRTRSPRGKVCEKRNPPECLFHKSESGRRFGEKCSYAHRQVDEQPYKRFQKIDDKSAVVMLKKNDLHESIRHPVVNRDKSHDRLERHGIKRDTRHERHGLVVINSSNTSQVGCVFQDVIPPKSILQKSPDLQKTIKRVKFTKAIARHSKIRDKNPSLGMNFPSAPQSA